MRRLFPYRTESGGMQYIPGKFVPPNRFCEIELPAGIRKAGRPVLVDERLIWVVNHRILCYGLDARKIWEYRISKEIDDLTFCPPMVYGDSVVVVCGGAIICLRIEDGSENWFWDCDAVEQSSHFTRGNKGRVSFRPTKCLERTVIAFVEKMDPQAVEVDVETGAISGFIPMASGKRYTESIYTLESCDIHLCAHGRDEWDYYTRDLRKVMPGRLGNQRCQWKSDRYFIIDHDPDAGRKMMLYDAKGGVVLWERLADPRGWDFIGNLARPDVGWYNAETYFTHMCGYKDAWYYSDHNSGSVHRIDPATSNILWRNDQGSNACFCTDDALVCWNKEDGTLMALDATSGEVTWTSEGFTEDFMEDYCADSNNFVVHGKYMALTSRYTSVFKERWGFFAS